MKLSAKGRCAVMALADLTTHSSGKPVSLAHIAARQDISLSYLEQLFGKLRRGGLVKSVRGPGGGYLLSRPAGETRISDIVLAVDGPIETVPRAPGSRGSAGAEGGCGRTRDLWRELGNQIFLFLNSVSLEDVVLQRVHRSGGPAPNQDRGA